MLILITIYSRICIFYDAPHRQFLQPFALCKARACFYLRFDTQTCERNILLKYP
jgi:hypothetical protein